MPSLSERRIDAWTALSAEPAVRAAERAIVTEGSTVLADTLAISAAAESRRRLAHVLDLKERAERDPRRREAYQDAADDLRSWAAGVYLATMRQPRARTSRPADRSRRSSRTPVVKHQNPHTEESISVRRLVSRPPFPGQRKRHPFQARKSSVAQGADISFGSGSDASPVRRSEMPHDPIERWEWEGGAITVDTNDAEDMRPDEVRGQPAQPGTHAEHVRQPSSSTISSRRRPPGASASTTSPTRRPSNAAPIGRSHDPPPAVGS